MSDLLATVEQHRVIPGEVWTRLDEFPDYGIGLSDEGVRVVRLTKAQGTRPGKLLQPVKGRAPAYGMTAAGKTHSRIVSVSTLLRMIAEQVSTASPEVSRSPQGSGEVSPSHQHLGA